MYTREELQQAAVDQDNTKLLQIVQAHKSNSDGFDLGEVLRTLDRAHLEELWRDLSEKATAAMLGMGGQNDEEQWQELDGMVKVVDAVNTMAVATISIEDINLPQALFETAAVFHEILPNIPEEFDSVKNGLSSLFEQWWLKELTGREHLIAQTVTYLLMRTLEQKPLVKDVKRVWKMKDSLQLINLSERSNATLKLLMEHCMASTFYLKTEDGRKFLSYIFCLDLDLMSTLHRVIKSEIPSSSKSQLSHYGEVYFNAWKNATGETLTKLEEGCIQDLMYRGIVGKRSVARNIREVLGYIHEHKIHPNVDEMLCRLYTPILWRNLVVANAYVRISAATLMIDAFPINNPKDSNQDNDDLLQKQFDTLARLLKDPVVMLRIVAVHGVCQIFNVYWEMIPADIIKEFIRVLCRDMICDSSSPEVRESVLRGLTALLDNQLSHPILKMALLEVKDHLHDISVRVRVAFLEMLLKVKGMRTIKFWDISPPEALLARLEIDEDPVVRRIVHLLFNSFLPVDKSINEQLQRGIVMLRQNAAAALPFYHCASQNHMTIGQSVRFMLAICKLILVTIEKDKKRRSHNQHDFLESSDEEEPAQAGGSQSEDGDVEAVDGEESSEGEISATDTELMSHLLEVLIVVWSSVTAQLNQPPCLEMRQGLEKRFAVAVPVFLRSFDDAKITSYLILLSGFLPPDRIPQIRCSVLSKLKSLDDADTSTEKFSSLLVCMCHWGQVGDLMQLIGDWLRPALTPQETNSDTSLNKSARRKSKKSVAFEEPTEPRPELALKLLKFLGQNSQCREALLKKRKPVEAITKLLKKVMKCAEKRFHSSEELSTSTTDEFILGAFEAYLKLEGILHQRESQHNAVTVLEDTFLWADCEILHLFKKHSPHATKKRTRKLMGATDCTLLLDGDGSQTQAALTLAGQSLGVSAVTLSETLLSQTVLGKRAAGDENAAARLQLATQMLETLLEIASNLLLCGVGSPLVASQLADFAIKVLQLDESTKFLAQVVTFMYQITEFILNWEEAERRNGPDVLGEDEEQNNPESTDLAQTADIPRMLKKVIEMATVLVKNKKEQAARLLPSIQTSFTELLSTYHRHLSLNQTINKEIISAVTTVCVAEVTEAIAKDLNFEVCQSIDELPTLSAFFLPMLIKRKVMFRLFLEELVSCMTLPDAAPVHQTKLAALTHLIHTITKVDKGDVCDVKECLSALQTQYENLSLPSDLSENAPERHLDANTRTLLKDCMTRVGMVA